MVFIASDLREEKLAAARELGVPNSAIVPGTTLIADVIVERVIKIDTVLKVYTDPVEVVDLISNGTQSCSFFPLLALRVFCTSAI
ncbi:hypothetical protein BDV24DRAFT_163977 [Aspergillus arachidicola]|uniref:Uncharacterized protein n=1 Tax=Aspergillus arachidicola TaxID=656916 RepID=A0A5N6Y8M6_9EURO|nr:hypothetical protein BDV24DRAFT_163977 [Aspergillus arachidicola]